MVEPEPERDGRVDEVVVAEPVAAALMKAVLHELATAVRSGIRPSAPPG